MTRRAFIGSTAGAAAGVVGAGLLGPGAGTAFGARRSDATPNPTTNQVELNGLTFSLTFFGRGLDPSTITDFNGFVGVADVQGTGTAHYPDGSHEVLLYDTDMRFMKGTYVAKDGHVHNGAFAFV